MVKKYLILTMLALTLILSSIIGYYNTLSFPKKIKRKELVSMTLNVYLDVPEEVEHLIFLIRVRNLTAQGIKPISEARIQPLMKPDGIKFNLRVWKIWNGYTEVKVKGKWVKKPIFKFQSIWIYAIAYDPETKTLYYGSWTRSLDPNYHKIVDVVIRVRAHHSTEVTADKVPEPGQSHRFTRNCTEAIIGAFSIPGQGSSASIYIPPDMPIPIDSYEKEYWTTDPEPYSPDAIWYEEDWEKSGTTTITTASKTDLTFDEKTSLFWFPSDVEFIMATEGGTDPYSEVTWVIVKVYANPDDTCGTPGWPWTPGTGTYFDNIPRPGTGCKEYPLKTVYILQSISVSYTFTSVIGTDTAQVSYSESVTFTYEAERYTIKICMNDWSLAPSDAQELAIYKLRDDCSQLRAEFKP